MCETISLFSHFWTPLAALEETTKRPSVALFTTSSVVWADNIITATSSSKWLRKSRLKLSIWKGGQLFPQWHDGHVSWIKPSTRLHQTVLASQQMDCFFFFLDFLLGLVFVLGHEICQSFPDTNPWPASSSAVKTLIGILSKILSATLSSKVDFSISIGKTKSSSRTSWSSWLVIPSIENFCDWIRLSQLNWFHTTTGSKNNGIWQLIV